MNLNLDCIRDVMLSIEELEFKKGITINELHGQLSYYSEDELHYTALKLHEVGLISVITTTMLSTSGELIVYIAELTYAGHMFLDNIRNDDVFKETKSTILQKVGSASIDIIVKLAAELMQRKLGI